MLQVEESFHKHFLPRLQAAVKAEVKRSKADTSGTGAIAVSRAIPEDGGGLPAGAAGVSNATRAHKSEKQDEDENEEDNEEYNEGKLRFAGTSQPTCIL